MKLKQCHDDYQWPWTGNRFFHEFLKAFALFVFLTFYLVHFVLKIL